jgi:heme/copper-type cytochrome/quinol oxidase subunit 2
MEDKIQHYRQPMVTATGIVLGFILNFASQWATNAFTNYRFKEFVIGISLCICIPVLLAVLYRVLNMHYPREKAASYYQHTLVLFITGIGIPFLAIIIVMIESYTLHRA